VPWLFDEESVAVLRQFAKLKNRLFPYLFAAAHDAHELGWPAMRAMVLEFPDDPACQYLDRQYMLGSSLMVAPVFRDDDVAEYYLPRGKWTNFLTGKVIEGGRWQRETVDFMHVPLFVRENTVLPMSANEAEPAWGLKDPLVLNLFQIADGADIAIRVAASEGAEKANFRCERRGSRITISGDGRAKDLRLVLRSWRSADRVSNGRALRETAEGMVIQWDDVHKPIGFSVED
jgi:alpha-D-xyloside xylohydrolase